MLEQFKRMASSAFDILLDTYDRQEQVVDTQVLFEQKLCGLWLAFRRGSLKLTPEQVEYRTGLDPYLLMLLETGLVPIKLTTQNVFQPEQRRQLALVLENEAHDFDQVMAIINTGLGIPSAERAQVLTQVTNELATKMQRLEELKQEDEQSNVYDFPPALTQVLVALEQGASTTLEIRKVIVKRTGDEFSVGIATINRILQELQKGTFIKTASETSDGENVYELTADGIDVAKTAVHLEEQRLEAEKQQSIAAVQEQQLQEQRKAAEEKAHRVKEEQRQLYHRVLPSIS